MRQRHKALLPGVAEHEQVAGDGVAEQRGGQLGGVEQQRIAPAQRQAHAGNDLGGRELHVRVRGEGARHRLVAVQHHLRAIAAHLGQRPVIVDHHHVAPQHQVGLAGGDAHRVQVFGLARNADMRGDRAALLRQAGLVEHAGALALQVPGHAQQRADGDHAGAADAGDEDVPGLAQVAAEAWCRQLLQQRRSVGLAALARLPTVHGDEAGAEPGHAGIVLVAAGLIDLALAPVFGLLRQHRHAEALLAAVAAAFADQRVDQHALGRIGQLAALAPAPLLGGAGLVVDQHAGALDLAQVPLHRVQLAAVVELHVAGEQLAAPRPLADVVADQGDGVHAFGTHLPGDVGHAEGAVHRLSAGHRHRVVVEDLVGDVDAGGDRLADRQRAAVEIGAVAQVLEHVRGVGERCLPGPGDAFAAHVGEGVGGAVHPRHHVVAADAAERARAFRHHRGGVVRAAGAVVRHAREIGARQRHLGFLGFHPAQPLFDRVGVHRGRLRQAQDAPADHPGDGGRGQFAGGRQDPFAGLVVLADDARARAGAGRPVVELLLHLPLDEGLLLLHHDDVLQPAGERGDAQRLQRPGHADLVHADADARAGVRVQAQVFQRLQHVQVALAGGDDAQPRLRRIHHRAVDAVGAGEGLRRAHRVAMQAHFLVQRRIRPADVEAARRQVEILRQHDLPRERIHLHRGRGLHRLGDGLEADPAPGVAAHRPAEQAHVEDVLHPGRIEHRHHRADELVLRAVRQGRAAARVVVGGQRQHAAMARGAGGVAVLEHVAAAVHARALAVPHGIHAIHARAGEQVGLLRAPDHGRAQVLVESGLEHHVGRVQMLARAPQFQVEPAQRAAAVTADEAAGVQPGGAVAQLLHQWQPHQRLHPGQIDAAIGAGVLVFQRIAGVHAVGGRCGEGGRRTRIDDAVHGLPGNGRLAGAQRLPRAIAPIVSAAIFAPVLVHAGRGGVGWDPGEGITPGDCSSEGIHIRSGRDAGLHRPGHRGQRAGAGIAGTERVLLRRRPRHHPSGHRHRRQRRGPGGSSGQYGAARSQRQRGARAAGRHRHGRRPPGTGRTAVPGRVARAARRRAAAPGAVELWLGPAARG
ncbi:hypothetical protein NB689_002606 [Xanthomonas sacchari]|nr:hypothetical protein [Xanthomonas sacchari]